MQSFKGLYALCDFQTLQKKEISLAYFSEIIYQHPTFYIQYRDKVNDIYTQQDYIYELKKYCHDIPIIVNDHLELLDIADGLHLGQEDLDKLIAQEGFSSKTEAIDYLKIKYPNKIFGISTHSIVEVTEANSLNLDYIGLGAYRNTSTKEVEYLLGDTLAQIAQHSMHPVAAIGGVTLDDRIENVTFNVVGSGLYDY